MQWLARTSVMRPVFAAVLILSLCVAGAFSFTKLGLDQMPNVDSPMVGVTTTMVGASPEEMDTSVTDVIEKQLNTISGIDTISSTSSEGISSIMVSFNLDKNTDVAFTEVQGKVNLAMASLPQAAKQPTVQKLQPDSLPILTFTLSAPGESIRDLTEYADKTLRPRIESVSGVGQALVVGGRSRQINITLDPQRLRAYGLTAIDVRSAIGNQNVEVPGGSMTQSDRRISVRTQGRFATTDEMKNLVVATRNGQPIHLADVAGVQDGEAEATSLARVNGQPTVLARVQKQSGANTVTVVRGIKERLNEIKPSLPKGYSTQIISDSSVFIEASVHTVEEHLILGALMAALIVLVFLWDIRATIISALAIPTSVIASFLLMWIMGYTLNNITLLALTLSVGIVIDDAILVLENIYRFLREKDMDPKEAALAATKEIGLAVLATTLSLVAIFLPVAFMSGMMGRIFSSFGITISFAIMVSLLVAFTLTPMLSSRWLSRIKTRSNNASEQEVEQRKHSTEVPPATSDKRGIFRSIEVGYWVILRWSLEHRWVVVTSSALVFLSTIPLLAIVNKEFIPNDDQSQFYVNLTAPEKTPLDGTGTMLEEIAGELRKMPDVLYTVSTAGTDSSGAEYKGEILAQLTKVGQRKSGKDTDAIMQEVRNKLLPRYPSDMRLTVGSPGFGGTGSAMAAISYVVSGPDLHVLQDASDRMVAAISKIDGVADVSSSASSGNPQMDVNIDRQRAADLGVSASDIANSIQIAVAGLTVSDFSAGGHLYDINLRGKPEFRDSTHALSQFTVPANKTGASPVPLNQVASFSETTGPATVKRYARARQITISVNIKPDASQQTVQQAVEREFEKLNLDKQYTGQFSAMSKEMGKAFTSFGVAMLLSIIFVYLILAAQFESWVHPITILISLPLSVPFALLSMWLTGGAVNVFTMLGILVLFGMVKKNSILQVDHANQLREEGYEREAAILNSSRDRLRPILMTTIAFVAGMLPMALSTGIGARTNRSASTVIIGGQTLSLLLSLIATPVFYTVMDDLTVAFTRARARFLSRFTRQHPIEAD